MNSFYPDLFAYGNFHRHKQYAELSPDGKSFRTFFVMKNHVLKKDVIVGETPFVIGEVPPTIQVMHPKKLLKIRSGSSY